MSLWCLSKIEQSAVGLLYVGTLKLMSRRSSTEFGSEKRKIKKEENQNNNLSITPSNRILISVEFEMEFA